MKSSFPVCNDLSDLTTLTMHGQRSIIHCHNTDPKLLAFALLLQLLLILPSVPTTAADTWSILLLLILLLLPLLLPLVINSRPPHV